VTESECQGSNIMNAIEAGQRQALGQIAEIKRIFQTIDHALQGRRPVAVLITSALSGEGKSLFATALATSAAGQGRRRVAVLDLNWYQPSVHRCFGLEPTQPMEHLLRTDIDALMIRSGDQGPDLLLAPVDHQDQTRMGGDVFGAVNRLIEGAKQSYDFVIVDSASVFPTNRMMIDPVLLSGLVDGVVMVIQIGSTPRQDVKRAQMVLQTAGANVVGLTINHHQVPFGSR